MIYYMHVFYLFSNVMSGKCSATFRVCLLFVLCMWAETVKKLQIIFSREIVILVSTAF